MIAAPGKRKSGITVLPNIRKRGQKYEARLQIKGLPEQTASFCSAEEAQAWLHKVRVMTPRQLREGCDTFAKWIHRLLKAGAPKDRHRRLSQVAESPLGRRRVRDLTPLDFMRFRDELLAEGVAHRLVREFLEDCSHVWEVARRDWRATELPNPLEGTSTPPQQPERLPGSLRQAWGALANDRHQPIPLRLADEHVQAVLLIPFPKIRHELLLSGVPGALFRSLKHQVEVVIRAQVVFQRVAHRVTNWVE